MSFRNINIVIPKEDDCTKFVVLNGEKFVESNLVVNLPSSYDYNLGDLLASGQRVVPVETSILHDDATTTQVVNSLINSSESTELTVE